MSFITCLTLVERPIHFRRPAFHGRSYAVGAGISHRVGQRVQGPRGSWRIPKAEPLVHPSETWSIKVKLCRCHKGSETIIQCSKTGFYGIPLRWDTDSFRHSAPPPSEREALARAPLTALPEKQGKPRLPRANRRARGKRKGPAGLAKPFCVAAGIIPRWERQRDIRQHMRRTRCRYPHR